MITPKLENPRAKLGINGLMDKNQAAGITLESGGKYRISLPNDTEKCLISGMTFLDSGDLVLTDKGNQKVKFVDKKFEFISQLSVSEPWDVCSVGNEIYVTFGTNTVLTNALVLPTLITDSPLV